MYLTAEEISEASKWFLRKVKPFGNPTTRLEAGTYSFYMMAICTDAGPQWFADAGISYIELEFEKFDGGNLRSLLRRKTIKRKAVASITRRET